MTQAGVAVSSTVIRRFSANYGTANENAPFYATYFNSNTALATKHVHITSGYSTATNNDFTISQGVLGPNTAKITELSIGTGNGPGASNFIAAGRMTLYGLKEGA
jgi:hypothetical protein